MVYQCCVADSEVVGNHIDLVRRTFTNRPPTERKGPLDSHLGHQESTCKAIGGELAMVKLGVFPFFNQLVYTRTVAIAMMAEFMSTSESTTPWRAQ